MTAVSPAFVVVDSGQELLEWVSTNCEESSEMKIVKHAKCVGTMIGPEGHLHRWIAARENSLKELGKSTGPPKA